ncbi:hypothetical protein EVAR_9284_1 [Eumeta japonica]|uniref:Uncharacterized protein n=1 Tax=Eumeta variegata TaxID=151549 RepID=A0A4C1TML4_EUMVA|nr:hypothetical protein EVAR_9284_1 [Eumeta japonica]
MNRPGYEYAASATGYYASDTLPHYERGYGPRPANPAPLYSPGGAHPLSNYADVYEGNNDTTLRAEDRHWYIENHKGLHYESSDIHDKHKKDEDKKTESLGRRPDSGARQRRKENRCSCECWPTTEENTAPDAATDSAPRSLSGVDMVASYGVYGNPHDDESGFGRAPEKAAYGAGEAAAQGVVVNQQGASAVVGAEARGACARCCWAPAQPPAANSEDYCWIHYCRPALIVLLLLFFLVLLGVSTGFLLTNNCGLVCANLESVMVDIGVTRVCHCEDNEVYPDNVVCGDHITVMSLLDGRSLEVLLLLSPIGT